MAAAKNYSDNNIIIVAGPTASGKSLLALEVAELLNGEIINGDSMQMYREFHVLTARPGQKEEARAAHHLYGALKITDRCSAGVWLKMALEIIDNGLKNKLSEVWGAEATLYYPGKYAGTADCIGIYEGKEMPVTASIGLADYRKGVKTGTDLFKRADEAVYQAKNGGRNQVKFYRD